LADIGPYIEYEVDLAFSEKASALCPEGMTIPTEF
jgi:hypothetical protein